MTSITTFLPTFTGMMENSSVVNPKLSQAIVSTDTVIKVTTAIQYPDGTIPTLPFVWVIKNATNGKVETGYAPASALSADGKTITLTNINQRGINPSQDASGNVDFASGSSTRRFDHPQGSEFRISIHPLIYKMMEKVLQGAISNNAHDFIVGDGTAANNTYSYSDTGGTKGLTRKNNATGKAQFSNDGTSWVNMDNAGIGVLAAGNAIDATALAAGTVQVKPTADTNVFVATSSGAGDQNKAPILGATGTLAGGFMNQTATSYPASAGAITGEIRMWSTVSAPTGWLSCDASAVSRATYAALYAIIGTTYGVGDGSTTFNLPDFRGRSPCGTGTGDATGATAHALATKAGAETHTITSAESGLPAHTHTVPTGTSTTGSASTARYDGTVATGSVATNANATADAASPLSLLHPVLPVLFIIKT